MKPSDFAQAVLMLDGKPFKLKNGKYDRKYIYEIYNGGHRDVLLYTGRQVEKSTTLGSKLVTDLALTPYTKGLYVAPTQEQSRVFSSQKIDPFFNSPFIRKYLRTSHTTDRVLQRQLDNGAELFLRYMYQSADRIRGISADTLCLDELQDLIRDEIPVVEEAQSHSENPFKLYAGTPKSRSNTIQQFWEMSSKTEWVVLCTHCGTYQTIEEHNIQRKGLSCRKCGGLIYPENGQWVDTATKAADRIAYKGFRIPQPVVPWIGWDDIWTKYTVRYSRQKFFNEVLARPYDMVSKPITEKDLIALCDPSRKEFDAEYLPQVYGGFPLVLGIDYATMLGESSYTVITIGGLQPSTKKYRLAFARKYKGIEADMEFIFHDVVKLTRQYKVAMIAADWGVGSGGQNARFRSALSDTRRERVYEFQLVGTLKEVIKWDTIAHLYRMDRTEILKYMFMQMKDSRMVFPRWECMEPLCLDILNIYSEYSEQTNRMKFDREPGEPDDFMFSLMFGYLGTLLMHKMMNPLEPRLPQYRR